MKIKYYWSFQTKPMNMFLKSWLIISGLKFRFHTGGAEMDSGGFLAASRLHVTMFRF